MLTTFGGMAAAAAIAITGPSGTTVQPGVSVPQLRYPAQHRFQIGYVVRTAGSADTVTISQAPPSWPDRRIAGSPIALVNPRLRGPGTLGIGMGIADYAFGTCVRGGGAAVPNQLRLELGPHEQATILETVRLTAPPWAGARFVPTASVTFADAPAQHERLPLAPVRVVGRSGVHIRLGMQPRRRQDRYPGTPVASGRAVTLSGSTEPPIEHARLRLSALVATGSDLRRVPIGVARTDAAGRFSANPWLPPFEGTYVVTAAYRHARAGLVPDRTCGLHFRVGRR